MISLCLCHRCGKRQSILNFRIVRGGRQHVCVTCGRSHRKAQSDGASNTEKPLPKNLPGKDRQQFCPHGKKWLFRLNGMGIVEEWCSCR